MQTAKKIQLVQDDFARNAIDKTAFLKVDECFNVPIYASVTCYFIAKLYEPVQLQHMIFEAHKALRTRDPGDAAGQKLRVLVGGPAKDYGYIWAVQDEEAITLMFPEDL